MSYKYDTEKQELMEFVYDDLHRQQKTDTIKYCINYLLDFVGTDSYSSRCALHDLIIKINKHDGGRLCSKGVSEHKIIGNQVCLACMKESECEL